MAEQSELTVSQGTLVMTHWSRHPLLEVRWDAIPAQIRGPKPRGLWLSDERDGQRGWKEWCKAEGFRLRDLRHGRQFRLNLSRTLWIQSAREMDQFTEDYRTDDPVNSVSGPSTYFIDRPQVAQRWAGILITPHRQDRRLAGSSRWYYGWDCASACVWSPEGIAG